MARVRKPKRWSKTIEVDGVQARVCGAGDWTEADQAAFIEVARAAIKMMEEREAQREQEPEVE